MFDLGGNNVAKAQRDLVRKAIVSVTLESKMTLLLSMEAARRAGMSEEEIHDTLTTSLEETTANMIAQCQEQIDIIPEDQLELLSSIFGEDPKENINDIRLISNEIKKNI